MSMKAKLRAEFSALFETSEASSKDIVSLLQEIGLANGGLVEPKLDGDEYDDYFVARVRHAFDRQIVYYLNILGTGRIDRYLTADYRKELEEDGVTPSDSEDPDAAFVAVTDSRLEELRLRPDLETYTKLYLKQGVSLATTDSDDVVEMEMRAVRDRLLGHASRRIAPTMHTTSFMYEDLAGLRARGPDKVHYFDSGSRDRVVVLYNATYFEELVEVLDDAKKSISVLMFYFPYDGRRRSAVTTKVFRALVAAHKRGVDVTVVLDRDRPQDKYNTRNINANTIRSLQRVGINARFDDAAEVTHSKVITVDDRWTFIGAHNLSNSASYRYEEISLRIGSRSVAKHYRAKIAEMR